MCFVKSGLSRHQNRVFDCVIYTKQFEIIDENATNYLCFIYGALLGCSFHYVILIAILHTVQCFSHSSRFWDEINSIQNKRSCCFNGCFCDRMPSVQPFQWSRDFLPEIKWYLGSFATFLILDQKEWSIIFRGEKGCEMRCY